MLNMINGRDPTECLPPFSQRRSGFANATEISTEVDLSPGWRHLLVWMAGVVATLLVLCVGLASSAVAGPEPDGMGGGQFIQPPHVPHLTPEQREQLEEIRGSFGKRGFRRGGGRRSGS